MAEQGLTVAVTGPTGTFGFGLVPRLQDDERVQRVVGIARRPFDPAQHGWTKMEYRQAMCATKGPCGRRSPGRTWSSTSRSSSSAAAAGRLAP
jgi:hypothetical protein